MRDEQHEARAAPFHKRHRNHLQLFGEAPSSQEYGAIQSAIREREYLMPNVLALAAVASQSQ
jgi:hypothetical protein